MTSANPLNVVETNQLPTRRGTDSNSYEARVMASLAASTETNFA
jgi:hypothetical protein